MWSLDATGKTTTSDSIDPSTGVYSSSSVGNVTIKATSTAYGITRSGTATINGGTLDIPNVYNGVTTATVTLNDGAITGAGTLYVNSTNTFELKNGTVSAALGGTGALNKTTAGVASAFSTRALYINSGGTLDTGTPTSNTLAGGSIYLRGGSLQTNDTNGGPTSGGTFYLGTADVTTDIKCYGDNSPRTTTLGPLVVSAAGNIVTMTRQSGTATRTIAFTTVNLGADLALSPGTGTAALVTGAVTGTGTKIAIAGSLSMSGDSSSTWTGAGGLTVTAGGTTLSAGKPLGLTTGTTISGGTLVAAVANVVNGATVSVGTGGRLDGGGAGVAATLANCRVNLRGGTLTLDNYNGNTPVTKNGNIYLDTADMSSSIKFTNTDTRQVNLDSLNVTAAGNTLTVAPNTTGIDTLVFGSVALGADVTLAVTSTMTCTVTGTVTGSGTKITTSGAGALHLNADSSATWSGAGGVAVNAGTVRLYGAKALGTTSGTTVGGGTLALSVANAANGAAIAVNSGAVNISTVANAANGASITINGGTVTNSFADGAAGANVTVSGGTLTMTQPSAMNTLSVSSGTVGGAGAITLKGAAVHAISGGTLSPTIQVYDGKLIVTGGTVTSNVTVGSSTATGTPTVGGTGTISGTLTVSSGGSTTASPHLAPGAVDGGGNSLVGALTCPNTVTMGTTGNKAELDFTVDGDTSSDQLIGAAGKTLTWNSCKLNITFTATEITAGPHTYNLFTNYTFANGNGAPTVTYVNDAGLACAFNAATGVLTVTK